MIRTFYFYKDEDGWFVDLPEWEGSKADLQMVAGADHFLDLLAQDEDGVHVRLSVEPFLNADLLELTELGHIDGPECGSGAWYNVTSLNGISYNFPIWLCDVTHFVFGEFPTKIYYKK